MLPVTLNLITRVFVRQPEKITSVLKLQGAFTSVRKYYTPKQAPQRVRHFGSFRYDIISAEIFNFFKILREFWYYLFKIN